MIQQRYHVVDQKIEDGSAMVSEWDLAHAFGRAFSRNEGIDRFRLGHPSPSETYAGPREPPGRKWAGRFGVCRRDPDNDDMMCPGNIPLFPDGLSNRIALLLRNVQCSAMMQFTLIGCLWATPSLGDENTDRSEEIAQQLFALDTEQAPVRSQARKAFLEWGASGEVFWPRPASPSWLTLSLTQQHELTAIRASLMRQHLKHLRDPDKLGPTKFLRQLQEAAGTPLPPAEQDRILDLLGTSRRPVTFSRQVTELIPLAPRNPMLHPILQRVLPPDAWASITETNQGNQRGPERTSSWTTAGNQFVELRAAVRADSTILEITPHAAADSGIVKVSLKADEWQELKSDGSPGRDPLTPLLAGATFSQSGTTFRAFRLPFVRRTSDRPNSKASDDPEDHSTSRPRFSGKLHWTAGLFDWPVTVPLQEGVTARFHGGTVSVERVFQNNARQMTEVELDLRYEQETRRLFTAMESHELSELFHRVTVADQPITAPGLQPLPTWKDGTIASRMAGLFPGRVRLQLQIRAAAEVLPATGEEQPPLFLIVAPPLGTVEFSTDCQWPRPSAAE